MRSLSMASMVVVCSAVAASVASAQVTRVSVAADGTQANGDSGRSIAMTPDGRYVAFASAATNLVTGDTNNATDVFVKDRQTGAIARVSVATGGAERSGDSGVDGVDISDDGMLVVFTSRAAFVDDDTNTCSPPPAFGEGPSCPDIYLHDRTTGQTVRISVSSGGGNANGPSRQPGISGAGQFVVFASEATNLVASDTNTVSDVFLRDRTAASTSRVSVSTAGGEATGGGSFAPAISGGAETIAFLSDATPASLGTGADPLACPASGGCTRAYVRVRATSTTTRVPFAADMLDPATPLGRRVVTVAITNDGRLVLAMLERLPPQAPGEYTVRGGGALYDVQAASLVPGVGGGSEIISGDGRYVGAIGDPFVVDQRRVVSVIDRLTGLQDDAPPVNAGPGFSELISVALSGTGRFLLFTSLGPFVSEDTNDRIDVFIVDRDRDGDGMFDVWEQTWGLDPTNAADAALDPDNDGQASLQEYVGNGHPTGAHRYYFAEGAENDFLHTIFAVANPNVARARYRLRYEGSDGRNAYDIRQIDPRAYGMVLPLSPPDNFSTIVESDQPLILNREMRWGDFAFRYLGSHLETAIAGPSTTWYLAEGATHGGFDLFYLLQNPNDAEAQVTVRYLRPAPLAPIVKTYPVGPHMRRTIWVDNEGPELAATDVSAAITSDRPLVVERAMYYSTPTESFVAGHDGAGVTAPATRWFLAEGATGRFFDLYVLVANPGDTDAALKVTYLIQDGTPLTKTYTAAAHSRLTIDVKGEDPRLANAAVSTIVESTNAQPIIVERAQWWPSGQWYEAHLSAGTTTTGTVWGFAGDVELSQDSDMYLLIANTSSTAGTATITFLPAAVHADLSVPLPPNSRVTIQATSLFPPLAPDEFRGAFGGLIQADVPIVVEQANYQSSNRRVWEQGSSALATKIQ